MHAGYAFTEASADLAMSMVLSPAQASNNAGPQQGPQPLGDCSAAHVMVGVLNWGIENVTMAISLAAQTSQGQTYTGWNVSYLCQCHA